MPLTWAVLTPLLTLALFAGWAWSDRVPGRVRPVRVWQSLVVGVLVAAAVYPLQVPKDYNFFFGDEGIVIAVAQRLAEGALLYRDVWEFLQPGSFVLLAGVFRVFGDGVAVLDACTLVLFGTIGALVHRLVAQLVSPRAGWLGAAAFVLALYPLGVWLSPHWMGTAAALAALACLVGRPPPGRPAALVCAGVCMGLTFLFQQHKGVFLAGTVGPMYLVLCLATGAGTRATGRAAVWMLAGAAVPAVPLVVWLTAHGLWGEWWYATFTWVREGYGPANATRPVWFPVQPGLSLGQFARGLWARADLTVLRVLPFALVAAPVTLLWRGAGLERWRVALVWAGALGVFGTALTRYESLRLLYTAPALLVLAAVTLGRLRAAVPPPRRGVAHLARVGALGASVLLFCAAAAQQYGAHVRRTGVGQHVTVDSPRGRVTLWSLGFGNVEDAAEVIAALRRVPPDSGLFVYPSGAGYGYLSGLRNPTPYHFVLPGYTRPAQWERLYRDVEAGRVDYVVWELNLNPQWMRTVYPTLPPASVWDHPFPQSLDGPEWTRMVDTPTVRLYGRAHPASTAGTVP